MQWIVGIGVPERVSQDSRWSSENEMLEIEPIEDVQSCVMTVGIAKRKAVVGGRLDHCS